MILVWECLFADEWNQMAKRFYAIHLVSPQLAIPLDVKRVLETEEVWD